MRDLFTAPFVQPVASLLGDYLGRIKQAEMVHLSAPATLEGVLALGQLEAACLDNGLRYRRRFTSPKKHVPRGEVAMPETPAQGLGVFFNVESETWQAEELGASELLDVVPVQTTVRLGAQQREHVGAIDPVIQAAALAAAMAPNGRRVRALRPYLSLGLWLRGALDTTYDPVHSSAIAHLQEEGSLRTVPLPEVPSPLVDMMPGLSERQLKRLSKAWPGMNVDERTLALSELVLPCLSDPKLSTPRLEELVWHRMVVRDHPRDIVSQAHAVQSAWPATLDAARVHASNLLDAWLSTAVLATDAKATG